MDRPISAFAEPSWEEMSPREQAQWLMTKAADVTFVEEKDSYVLRAIARLLMSVDDRLGAMQAHPAVSAYIPAEQWTAAAPSQGPGSTHTAANWEGKQSAVTDEGTQYEYRWVVGSRVVTPAGQVGEITRIKSGPAGTFADTTTDRGHQLHLRVDRLRPAPAPLSMIEALRLAIETMETVATSGPVLGSSSDRRLTECAVTCRKALVTE